MTMRSQPNLPGIKVEFEKPSSSLFELKVDRRAAAVVRGGRIRLPKG